MKIKKLISIVLACTSLTVSLTACASSPAGRGKDGDGAELKLIIASNQTSLDNPYNYGLDKFKETIEELSGGKVSVTVHKGTLGENESELIEKMALRACDMVVASPGYMTAIGVPELDIFSLEYMFDSFEHWEKCVTGEFGESMKDVVLDRTKNNFRIMGYWTASVRDVYAKKAVKSPADLKGMTVRVQSSVVQQDFWKACGAIPTNVAWGELYQALQQGVVDGAENDYTNLMLKEHHKTDNGKYISETQHDYTTRLWLIDGNFFDSLTEEQQRWIEAASEAATEEVKEVTLAMYDQSKEKCIADGAVITEGKDIDIEAFQALAVPIQDQFAQKYGLTEEIQFIRNAAK